MTLCTNFKVRLLTPLSGGAPFHKMTGSQAVQTHSIALEGRNHLLVWQRLKFRTGVQWMLLFTHDTRVIDSGRKGRHQPRHRVPLRDCIIDRTFPARLRGLRL